MHKVDGLGFTDPILIENLLQQTSRSKRQALTTKPTFETEWVKFPLTWHKALHRAKSAGSTYDLAHTILFEAFRREHIGDEIVLSARLTGMSKNTRIRAAKALADLGLIELCQTGNGRAYKIRIYYKNKN